MDEIWAEYSPRIWNSLMLTTKLVSHLHFRKDGSASSAVFRLNVEVIIAQSRSEICWQLYRRPIFSRQVEIGVWMIRKRPRFFWFLCGFGALRNCGAYARIWFRNWLRLAGVGVRQHLKSSSSEIRTIKSAGPIRKPAIDFRVRRIFRGTRIRLGIIDFAPQSATPLLKYWVKRCALGYCLLVFPHTIGVRKRGVKVQRTGNHIARTMERVVFRYQSERAHRRL